MTRFRKVVAAILPILVFTIAGSAGLSQESSQESDTKAKRTAGGIQENDAPPTTEKAYFGGGCFWCTEAVFERVTGVKDVISGYAGGSTRKPTYQQVLTGTTGHAEVVQVEFDPARVTYEELLKVFWYCHDPTSLNQQGPDFGTQYRSIILYADEDQRAAAEKSMRTMDRSGEFGAPIVTEIVPFQIFYAAEKYHQDYYRKHKNAAYCQINITPKLQSLKQKFGSASTGSAESENAGESPREGAGATKSRR